MEIKLTDFVLKDFADNGGRKIKTHTPDEFNNIINNELYLGEFLERAILYMDDNDLDLFSSGKYRVKKGYADFVYLITIPNFTDGGVGSLKITLENYQYLRSGYVTRREGELPVLSRWFELPLDPPVAEYITLVLYSKGQLKKEHQFEIKQNPNIGEFNFKGDYGIVAILLHDDFENEPLVPITMMRNALGIEEGGSGSQLNKDEYLKSVKFWNEHAVIKY